MTEHNQLGCTYIPENLSDFSIIVVVLIEMKTHEDWLKEFRAKIEEGYETQRMDKRLAGFAHEHEKPVKRLWKYDQPITAQTMVAGQPIIVAPSPTYRNVEAFQVGIRIDLSQWNFKDPIVGSDSYMFGIGSRVAENEYHAIVKGISDNAGNVIKTKKKGELSKLDLKEAQAWIGSYGNEYAETVIVPLEQKTKWLIQEELWLPHKIPTGYLPEKERGMFFSGWINGVNVYWMRFLKDFALIYAKRKAIICNTPMKIYYDNPKRPKELFVSKWCSSAPILDQAVVKITL